jgi:DNA repair exonuclease SbcCD nuclease subunit
LHLGASFAHLSRAAERLQLEQLDTFNRMVELAIQQNVKALLVAGDLFDSYQPEEQVLAKVKAGFLRLAEQGILVLGVPGTHDSFDHPGSVYRKRLDDLGFNHFFRSSQFDEPYSFEVEGENVLVFGRAHIIGQSPKKVLEGLSMTDEDAYHVGLLHCTLVESPQWEVRPADMPVTLKELEAVGFDYWALGHHHNFSEIRSKQGELLGAYPGTPLARKFGENGDRFVLLVTLADDQASLDRIKVNRLRFEERDFDVSGTASLEELVDVLCQAGAPETVLRGTLTGIANFPIDLESARGRAAEAFYWLDEIDDQSQLWQSEYVDRLKVEPTVKGIFVRRMLTKIESAKPEERQILQQALKLGILAAERALP